MNQHPTETAEVLSKDVTILDEALKSVWDKVRLASQLINQLRDEKRKLNVRTEELDRLVSSLRSEVLGKDQELKRLRAEHAQLLNANGHQAFTDEDKENLKGKIRDLISKINSYL